MDDSSTNSILEPWPTDVDGFWAQDRIHAPRPITPLAVDLITDTMAIGFTDAHREYGAPLDMRTRPINHYLFSSMRPPTDPDELARRAERYTTLPQRLDEVGSLWERVWKPQLIESVRAGRLADYRGLSNAELADELEAQRRHMLHQWTIHGKINFGVVAGARFVDFYNDVVRPDDLTEGYQALQGFETQTVRTTEELWKLSRMVLASPDLQRLFDSDNHDVFAQLAHPDPTADVARFAAAFSAFLDEYGWRSDAVYDIADITWREDPTIPLDALRSYLRLSDEQAPAAAFARAVERREALLAAARAKLADEPDVLAQFDHFYEAGRHNLPLTEDHAFWIDQSGVANVRRFVLQLAEALVRDGLLDQIDDVFHLSSAEVIDALRSGADHRSVIPARRASFDAAAATEAPRTLGTPPPPPGGPLDPLVDAIVVRLAGRRPPQPLAIDLLVSGLPASPGVVTGVARVVRTLAEAAKLDDGDILVCEMTLPPWVPLFAVAGAVVADTGGLMSHCAIIAREFGLPAVVGTLTGTSSIVDGMVITVDGDRGEVRLATTTTPTPEPDPAHRVVTDRSAWRGSDLEADRSWEYQLTDRHIEELDQALGKMADRPLDEISRADFDLPTLAPMLRSIGNELRDGLGFAVARGLPVDRYELSELERIYWGMCSHLGTGMTQNSDASLIHYVTDGKLRPNQGLRGVGSPKKSGLHVDLTDAVSLLCVRQAPDEPLSWLASSTQVYNEFVRHHPEHLPALFEGFEWDRLDEQGPGERVTSGYKVPVFSIAGGKVSCRYNRYWMSKAMLRTADRLPDEIWALFNRFDEIAEANRLDLVFEPGDIQFANNYTVLHGRAAHDEVVDEDRKRLLMRIWVDFDEGRPVANEAIVRYGVVRHGALGWTAEQLRQGRHQEGHDRDAQGLPLVVPAGAGIN